jgi:hypothetical protein
VFAETFLDDQVFADVGEKRLKEVELTFQQNQFKIKHFREGIDGGV